MLPFPREFPLLFQEFEIFSIQIKWKSPQISPLQEGWGNWRATLLFMATICI